MPVRSRERVFAKDRVEQAKQPARDESVVVGQAANDGKYAAPSGKRNTAMHLYVRARAVANENFDLQPAWRRRSKRHEQPHDQYNDQGEDQGFEQFSNEITQPGDDETSTGFPTFNSMLPVLGFLMIPGLIVIGITITGGHWPKGILYLLALVMGCYVFASIFRGAELALAVLLLYLPFSPVYVIPLGPGVNGTNALIGLGILATIMQAREKRVSLFNFKRGSPLVFFYAGLTIASGFTMLVQNGGKDYLLGSEIHTYKGWIEQFIVYFIALSAIRTHGMARRVFFYMCIGSVLIVIYTVPEMLSKQGLSSIEKSRIAGPLLQSNEFGGFVAYTLLFTAGLFLAYFGRIKAFLMAPYFLIALKVLISTFSRGAYLALAVGGMIAGFLRGKRFIAVWAALGISFFVVFPQFLPQSIVDRLGHSVQQSDATAAGTKLDKSSEHRLVLWEAAVTMTKENPVLGTGFKGFARYKHLYTEHDVREKDPHNYYLYVASQMGLPALLLFLIILAQAFFNGCRLSKVKGDVYVRAMGMAGAGSVTAYAAVCMFGSRAVSPEFTCYFWVMLACMQVLSSPDASQAFASQRGKRAARRSNIANGGNQKQGGASRSAKNTTPSARSGRKGRNLAGAAAASRQGTSRKSVSAGQPPARRQRKFAGDAAGSQANTGRKRTSAFKAAK